MQCCIETVDNYFYFGGKKAYVIPGEAQQGIEGTILIEEKSSPGFLVTALKVIVYLNIAMSFIFFIAKVILRSIHSFYIIDTKQKLGEGVDISSATLEKIINLMSKQKLEEGVNISSATLEKIESLMPKIQSEQDDPEIIWHKKSSNLVFSLIQDPDFIFKMRSDRTSEQAEEELEKRFANMVKAKKVCLVYQLDRLVIPKAKKVNVAGIPLIAEQYLDINRNYSAQEDFYRLLDDETVRQLAIFIIKTGFSDVSWDNIPLIDTAPEFQGNRRVGLVDLEHMLEAADGFFGNGMKRNSGLVNCLHSEAHIDIALAEAERHGVFDRWGRSQSIKTDRLKKIQTDQELQQFYESKGILENPRKPIEVDVRTLNFGIDVDSRTDCSVRNQSSGSSPTHRIECFHLEAVAKDVIARINEAITKTPENASIKGKRRIFLCTSHDDYLNAYNKCGLSNGMWGHTDEENNRRWLRRIIDALVAERHCFKLLNEKRYFDYEIQA